MPMFKSKRATANKSATAASVASRKRKHSELSYTAPPLPKQCDVRGREGKTDNSPQSKAKIAVEYERHGCNDRATARALDISRGLPSKYAQQVDDHDMLPKREGNCGRKGLLERQPDIEDRLRELLGEDDEQGYRELGEALEVDPMTLWRACQKLKLKLYLSYKAPTQTAQQILDHLAFFKNLLTGRDPNGAKECDFKFRFWQDEKWFYCERTRQWKKILPGMKPKQRWGHRRFPAKTMFSGVVGCPIFDKEGKLVFDGLVMLRRVATWKKAERKSKYHARDEVYPVDCEMNARRFKGHLRSIGQALREKMGAIGVPHSTVLTLQIDGAGGHGIARGHGKFEKLKVMMKEEYNIRLVQQCSGCPQSNLLDLMVWKMISSSVLKLSRKRRKDRSQLAITVEEAFLEIEPAQLDLACETLRDVARCCVEDGGKNTRRNGGHGGARARQATRLGEDGFAAMKDFGLHDEDDPWIGGVMSEWEDSSDEEEEEEDSGRRKKKGGKGGGGDANCDDGDDRERPSRKSWRGRLRGMKFKDVQEGEYFQVRDVYWAKGYAPSSEDDDEPFEGWVAEYFPCSKGGKNAKDPGRDHPSVEWSPLGFLRGKESWAKWL